MILYSVGLIPDIFALRLTPTGGFFVKTSQTAVSVSIDGKNVKYSGFLSRGVLVNNLPAGIIAVEVAKEGFASWRKSIVIENGLIQEFPYVLLIPEEKNITTVSATSSISGIGASPKFFSINPAGTEFMLAISQGEKTVFRILAREGGRDVIPPLVFVKNGKLLSADWIGSGSSILVHREKDGENFWDIIGISDKKTSPLISPATKVLFNLAASTSPLSKAPRPALTGRQIKRVAENPTGGYYLFDGENIFDWQEKSTTTTSLISDLEEFQPLTSNLILITKRGFLAISDTDGKNVETIDRPGFFLKGDAFDIKESKAQDIYVVDGAGGLYILDAESKKIQPITGAVSETLFSPDGAKLAYISGSKLYTLLMVDEKLQPFRKKLANDEVLDASMPITDFIWSNKKYSHLIFTTKNGIFITEADSRFGANTTTLATGQYLIAASPTDPNGFYFTDGITVKMMTIE